MRGSVGHKAAGHTGQLPALLQAKASGKAAHRPVGRVEGLVQHYGHALGLLEQAQQELLRLLPGDIVALRQLQQSSLNLGRWNFHASRGRPQGAGTWGAASVRVV